jgi:hypothetical protein
MNRTHGNFPLCHSLMLFSCQIFVVHELTATPADAIDPEDIKLGHLFAKSIMKGYD